MTRLYSAIWYDGHPFDILFDTVEVVQVPDDLEDTDSVLVVWGGADIDPQLYGHPRSVTTHPGGKRDVMEWALMQEALKKGIPIIGVCRGAQMLCALAGGYLIQDVRGHHGGHNIHTFDEKILRVNSIHHQMMEPSMTDHKLLAWSAVNRSFTIGDEGQTETHYIWKNDQQWIPPKGWKEPEFVHFTKVNGFAIQWHPEMLGPMDQANLYVLDYLEKNLCLNKTKNETVN